MQEVTDELDLGERAAIALAGASRQQVRLLARANIRAGLILPDTR